MTRLLPKNYDKARHEMLERQWATASSISDDDYEEMKQLRALKAHEDRALAEKPKPVPPPSRSPVILTRAFDGVTAFEAEKPARPTPEFSCVAGFIDATVRFEPGKHTVADLAAKLRRLAVVAVRVADRIDPAKKQAEG